jgi:P27 family predicted phage terminase small subunit
MSKKKSTNFHRLAGSYRADRHVNGSLRFPPATGTAPRWLSKAAKAEWRRVAPLLLEAGLLLETDAAILGAYCSAFAGYLESKSLVEKQGQVIIVESQTRTGRTSKPIRNPAVTLMFDFQRAMLAAAAKLGFSPFDRERIEGSIDADEGEQPLQSLHSTLSQPTKNSSPASAPDNAVHGDALGAFIKFPTAEESISDE